MLISSMRVSIAISVILGFVSFVPVIGAATAWPGADTTGPVHPELLTPSGSLTLSVAGAVIQDLDIAGKLTVKADGITIRNCRITGGSPYCITIDAAVTGLLIEDCELDGGGVSSSALLGGGFTARRCDVHHTMGDGFKPTSDLVVEDCWIHHLGMGVGSHADGMQMAKGGRVIFRRNNFDMPIDVDGFHSNSACFIMTDTGPIDDVLIEGNRFDGGNYTIYLVDKLKGFGPPTNVRVIGNTFGPDYRYGTSHMDGTPVWTGNVFEATGAPVSTGTNSPSTGTTTSGGTSGTTATGTSASGTASGGSAAGTSASSATTSGSTTGAPASTTAAEGGSSTTRCGLGNALAASAGLAALLARGRRERR